MAVIAGTSSFLPGDSIVIEPQAKWDYYEDISGAGGTCPMCGTERIPNQAHACAKPDYDKPAVPVPVRGETLERHARLVAFHQACVDGNEAEINRLRKLLHTS